MSPRPPSDRPDQRSPDKPFADKPFVLTADDLAPTTMTPSEAPPPPDDDLPPQGDAMLTVTRLAARKRRGGLLWTVAASLVTLVVSVTAYDYLMNLLVRYPTVGMVALALTGLFAVLVVLQLFREIWAFRRLARIDSFRTDAAAALGDQDREAALALSRRLGGFYGGRTELRWALARLEETREEVLDADAILDLTERMLFAPLDAAARREIEAAARTVAAATAVIPLALVDVLAATSQNLRMIRRVAEVYGAHAGFFGSWRLLRTVATHLLATGLVSAGDDLIGSVAGGHVLARLSRRFGEGMVNGALTARVGIAAMDVCRPLPFSALPRPKVTNVISRALTGLFERK
ncbi:putative membrane protein [Amaricoccus macauensis]|uniref:Putative membrane protein n=1 Tax=Amaricoccus macauensis TaxID=57001 RepID=A0A840SHB9_9RHOB|nr:TIGR01620 family protein [Amaricoccus macauensis]MBB5220324.1 putative membrane protein [Amaricoccus macauensis]